MSISGNMRASKGAAVQAARREILDELKEFAIDTAVQNIISFFGVNKNFVNAALGGSDSFGEFVTEQICSNVPVPRWAHFAPAIAARKIGSQTAYQGDVIRSAFSCQSAAANGFDLRNQINGLPSKSYGVPDFVFGPSTPEPAQDRDDNWLIGDFKLTLQTALNSWKPSKQLHQLKAMRGYARKHQFGPFVAVIAFSNSSGKKGDSEIRRVQSKMGRGVIAIIATIKNRKVHVKASGSIVDKVFGS